MKASIAASEKSSLRIFVFNLENNGKLQNQMGSKTGYESFCYQSISK